MFAWALAWLAFVVPEPIPPPPPPPTPALELRWSAPQDCPSGEQLLAEIEALVGRPLAGDPTQMIEVDGAIVREADAYVLELRVAGPSGAIERRFTAPQCAAVVEPAAVVIAIAVDPLLESIAHVTTPLPEVPSGEDDAGAPLAIEPSTRAAEPTRAPARRVRPGLALVARGGMDGGNLPGARGTLEGTIGMRFAHARIELGAIHLFARTLPDRSGPAGSFRTTAARAQACWEPQLGQFSFPTCAGLELGVIAAAGIHVQRTSTARHFWLGLLGGSGVMWAPVARFALGVRGELVVAPQRRGFTIADQPLLTTAVVGGRGSFAVELRLP